MVLSWCLYIGLGKNSQVYGKCVDQLTRSAEVERCHLNSQKIGKEVYEMDRKMAVFRCLASITAVAQPITNSSHLCNHKKSPAKRTLPGFESPIDDAKMLPFTSRCWRIVLRHG
jgi:hypothetical protein